MTSAVRGQVTLPAIKCLQESGEKGFEKLTATLLSLLIGLPIRLCKSGDQAGIDAMADPAEIPVAIEDKRYQSGTLDLDSLRGRLAAAAQTYPDLQLWVLATTVEVSPLQAQALRNTGESLGLAVLILDSAAAQPQLPEIASIVALCASAPDETLNAISTPEWLDAKLRVSMPPIDKDRCRRDHQLSLSADDGTLLYEAGPWSHYHEHIASHYQGNTHIGWIVSPGGTAFLALRASRGDYPVPPNGRYGE